MRTIFKFILFFNLAFAQNFDFDTAKLDSYSLSEIIEYLSDTLNKNLPQKQNHIITIQEAHPKGTDTLEIIKTIQASQNDMNSAILVDTILNTYRQDRDFLDDFVDSEINIYCSSEYSKYLFKRGGYIRVILKNPQDDTTLIYFDLAKESCK